MSSSGSLDSPQRNSSRWAVALTLILAFSTFTGNAGALGGVTLSKTTVAVSEGAATDSYTVVLNSVPTSNVSVVVNGNVDVSVSPSSLTFTPANWNVAQPVTVTAVNDRIYESDHSATVTHSSVSSDANYNGLTIADVTANVSDNEFIVFGISDVNGNFAPTSGEEGVTTVTFNMFITVNSPVGGSGSFGFDLGFQVPYSVTAGTATGGGVDYTLADGSSTFTATQTLATPNLFVPFTATIVDDALPEPAETITITAGTDEIGTSGSYAAGIFRTTFVGYQAHTYTILASDNEVAPSVAYNPTTGTTVDFTGVTTTGTTGTGTIAATPSGGIGTGAPATTTINSCTLGGTNPGSFAGAAAINLSFVGNTTTPQNLALTCTSQQTAQTATLTCNETRGSDAPVQRQWPLNCPAGTAVAPSVAYNPTTGSSVAFTGVTTIGTTGTGTIAATPSGGIGTGAPATTTINTCTLGGTNPGSFAGAAAINLSFVGNTTTPQNLALTCTSQQTAQTATLTCNETRGSDAPVQRQWPLNCPAGAAVAPSVAYNPTTGTTVDFTGVTTTGTTGTGTIAATPSGGIGTGAPATTTINSCTLGGTNPGSFAGAAAINLSFVGNTTTPQNLALTCTSQQTAQTATLTCNETRGSDAPVQRQWPLNCPAGAAIAPSIAYNPTTGSSIAFTGVTTIGTTGNGTIAATPSGGIGTGAPATTTINTCTLGGTNPGSFAGAAAINLSFVGNTTTPQNLALTCTSQQTAQAATLTCNETRGSDAPVQRQWPLNCPAGTLSPLTSAPVSGTTVNLSGIAGGATTTSTITVTNPNPIAVELTCTAPAFPFTATPLVFSIPNGGNAPITVGISPAAGSYAGTLNCAVSGSSQVLSFSLTGSVAAPIAVNATSVWSLMVLMLSLFGFAAVAVRRQG